jgi:two-component system, cell cycle response regulator
VENDDERDAVVAPEPRHAIYPKVPDPGPYSECLLVVDSKDPTSLGRRIALYGGILRVGRGIENDYFRDDALMSRRHARFERRDGVWWIVDDGSSNGVYCNDQLISSELALKNGDRIKMGATTFKLLDGANLEEQCQEEVRRLDVRDDLTKLFRGRYFKHSLEHAIDELQGSKHGLALVLLEVDDLVAIDDLYLEAADDFVLKDLARVILEHHRSSDVSVRLAGRQFGVLLCEQTLETTAASVAELRRKVADHIFAFQSDTIQVKIRFGSALFSEGDSADELIERARDDLDSSPPAAKGPIFTGVLAPTR